MFEIYEQTPTNIVLTLILKLFAAKKIFKGTFFIIHWHYLWTCITNDSNYCRSQSSCHVFVTKCSLFQCEVCVKMTAWSQTIVSTDIINWIMSHYLNWFAHDFERTYILSFLTRVLNVYVVKYDDSPWTSLP